jgi:hypothetical protein
MPRKEQRQSMDRVHNRYQTVFLLVDFAAALLFVVGSILFFYPERQASATWCFLIGSIFFAFKPTLRLARFLHIRQLANKAELSVSEVLQGRSFY